MGLKSLGPSTFYYAVRSGLGGGPRFRLQGPGGRRGGGSNSSVFAVTVERLFILFRSPSIFVTFLHQLQRTISPRSSQS
ncbi:uncharacterized protein LMH87_009104 [Akanthomyces muscarius]|uniref:Uncharacterized protein n=1 Tax=Akanthomyces muscarius TaxID=2231603 RepID=A0A9W8UMM3_AKAMU|nr:uncharacterized protein LMH87_009104 [Akanthomyces muscarius]KAJ4158585.1 hypothetical protein LMH87_009104 [Akanthomyces muscarius]